MPVDDLRPCPFCGYSDTYIYDKSREADLYTEDAKAQDIVPNGWVVYCGSCATDGPSGETEADARKFWNMRAHWA
jgi:Lar family restriction alleviation protein